MKPSKMAKGRTAKTKVSGGIVSAANPNITIEEHPTSDQDISSQKLNEDSL